MRPLAIADACLPGSGLVVDGRIAAGVALLVPAVLGLAAMLMALLVGGALALWVAPRALPAYALLAVIALLLRWHYARRERIDPARTNQLAREAAKAWLRGEDAEAVAQARLLVGSAPELPNAWRLLGLVGGDAKAEARAAAIERRSR